jgi:hypothetical protein
MRNDPTFAAALSLLEMPFQPMIRFSNGDARYLKSKTVRKKKPNRNHISRRVKRKHRRAA